MPKTEDGKKTGAAARAEQAEGGDNFVSQDTFENPALKNLANTATVTDGFGIERIVSTPSDFTPAPLHASDEQIKAAEEFQSKLDEAKSQRTALLQGSNDAEAGAKAATELSDVDDSERAVNNPAVGGTAVGGSPAKDVNTTTTGGGQTPEKEK